MRSVLRRSGPALAGLALSVGLAACGGDETPTLSAEEFRKQGNAICEASDAEMEKRGEERFAGDKELSREALAELFTEDAIPLARRRLDRLARLRPPVADRKGLEEFVAAGRRAIDEVEEGLQKDPEGFLAQTGPDPFEDFDDLALDLGLDRCARESGQ